jgi:hypothetical protein
MKIVPLLAAAGIAAVATLSVPAGAQRTVVAVTAGPPEGDGWVSYRETHYATDWDGPRYYDREGPHHGWYSWNNGYYQNCSYRVTPHGHKRDWHCW